MPSAPKIKLLSIHDARKPYPLDWEEQERFFAALPGHLNDIALFGVNTGCRDQEICKLRWSWEVKVPIAEIGSVFIIPGDKTKNGEDRLVVLNRTARLVIERQRGKHPEIVFVYKGKPLTRIMNSAWKKARKKMDLSNVRVHDLLGQKSTRITTHYSAGELLNLWEAANKVCLQHSKPTLTLLRTNADLRRANVAQGLMRVK